MLGATTPAQGPKASAFLNLGLQLGGSAGVALLTVFIDRREAFHSTILAGAATLRDLNIDGFAGTTAQLAHLVDTQSVILSYADATYLIGFLGMICLPLVLLLRRPQAVPRITHITE